MTDQIQSRLLKLAAGFLVLFCIILTLSPAVRERSWEVDYRWSHWTGLFLWALLIARLHGDTRQYLPERDPYLLPAAALMSGWGLLTIWRLDTDFGARQTMWMILSIGSFILGVRFLPEDLSFLRRYKYILLSGGLILTGLTLLLGTNPGGIGPRLWLGCCGIYFQPSEPLKLLLVIYLAAYLADHLPIRTRIFPLLLPTGVIMGLALLLLLVQRDLGTASIFILLYTVILFLATGRGRVLLATSIALVLAGLIGYFSIEIIHIRIDAWLNPWLDPSGRAYQIIQSLLAVANGGTIGRGPGLGSPGLVPVAISDFIFSAIAEETGLTGTIGLLALFGVILARGLRASLRAPDLFRRLLAGGLTAFLVIQAILIIGGNLRLLPLTGVTLPFVSYGGSSLLTSFIALFLLLRISSQPETEPAVLHRPQPYVTVHVILALGLIAAALADGWWAIVHGPDLLKRTDNPRRSIADHFVPRGALLDRRSAPIDLTQGEIGTFTRAYLYPDLGPVTGYTHPTFGQAGLEASLDEYLRGLQGNPASTIWLDHLLYGTPPPGLDVRLSLDLELQRNADELLASHKGAIILINAKSGEILVMASHPTYDPNNLDEEGVNLAKSENAPLINRAAQGFYLAGNAVYPFVNIKSSKTRKDLYASLGFYRTPELRMQVAPASSSKDILNLRLTPLQMALAASAMSNHGVVPAPRIATAVNTPQQGWVVLPALSQPIEAIQPSVADEAAQSLAIQGQPIWQFIGRANQEETRITWFLGGTLPNWQGTPLAIIVALEEDNISLARQIGQAMLKDTLGD